MSDPASADSLDFYRTPATMSALPDRVAISEIPSDLDEMRQVVQGVLLHRDWAPVYGLANDTIRRDEANLRSTTEVLRFGIFDMWGLPYISGNLINDFAALNKVEMLPWDSWGMMTGPYHPVSSDALVVLDDLAAFVNADDFAAIHARYRDDERLRVPADILTFLNGEVVEVHIDL